MKGSVLAESDGTRSFTNPVNLGITLPSGKIPVGNFALKSYSGEHYWWVRAQCSDYATVKFGIYLTDGSNHSVKLFTLTFSNSSHHDSTGFVYTSTATISRANTLNFTGDLYLKAVTETGPSPKYLQLVSPSVYAEVDVGDPTLAITVNSSTGGSCTASAASATPGSTITLTPTANTGYHHTGYTTSPSVTITNNKFTMPSSAITVTANFAKTSYTVTVASVTGGSCTADKATAKMGDTVTLTPTASTGYKLSSYTTSPSVTVSSNKFTMPAGNITITPSFTKISYTVTVSAGTGGSLTTNKATAKMGDSVTLTPTANSGYKFSSYTKTPSSLSISNNAFTMPAQNVSITANFTKINYAVTVASVTGGTCTASKSTAQMGDTVTLTTTASAGYKHTGYTTSPSVTVTNNAFTMPAGNITITPTYSKISYTITVNAGTGGTCTANKSTAKVGDTVTLTPTANTGYQLSSYTTSPSVTVSSNAFTMPAGNITVTANFTKIKYTVTVSAGTGGSLTASKSTAVMGDSVTLTPTPNTGYKLSSYTKTPSTLAISSNKFTMPAQNVSVTANFSKVSYTITVASVTGGSCTANKATANYGDSVTLTPTASTGYRLTGYTTSPSVTVTNNAFTMPAGNITITPTFSKISYTVTVSAGTGGTCKADKSTAKMGDTVTLTPTPSTGYKLSSYTKTPSGLSISSNKFTMPAQNVSVTANFTKISYTITKAVSPTGGGTVSVKKSGTEAATANYGDSMTVTQTPATGYAFKAWTTSPASLISSGAFTMPAQNVTVTATYYKISTPSLNKTSMDGGTTVTLTIDSESTAYTHKYKLSFGTNMETSLTSVAAGVTSVSISVPLNWSAQIPSATSKTGGSLVLETYSGSTKIGQKTITGLTYNVPSTVKPTIGTITTSIVRTIGSKTYANIGNYYVQNHCGVRVQTTASGAQSSTITSLSVSIGGYSGNSYNRTVQTGSIDFTSGLLPTAGSVTISVNVTDSRGRTNTKSATITVSAYSKPSGSLRLWRVNYDGNADDMGTYGKYQLTKKYTQLGSNALTWTLSYSGGSASSPANTGNLLPSSRKVFSQENEYTFTLTLTDSMQETTTITASLPSARFIFACDTSGNKIGIMKYPNQSIPSGKARTLEISADTQIYIGNQTLEQYIQSLI